MSVTKAPLVLLLFVAGCGTMISTTMVNPSPRPLQPRPPETVDMFTSGPPARSYVDVAFFEAEQESEVSLDETREFLAGLRERAASMGCDGLVVGSVTNRTSLSLDLDSHSNIKGLTGTCIVYTDPEPSVATTAPSKVD
jgi:hypothetical protein